MQELDTGTSIKSISEIQSFFKDCTIFITGATGFLGHVLLAKLLKSCPDVKKIYILLREKKGKSAMDRFHEMMKNEIFGNLTSQNPELLEKVKPIAGDCLEPQLGMSKEHMELLKNEVNTVFHVAATVKFDAPLKYAVHMNVRSTSDLLDLAHEMKSLKSFVYVSTAFSNCVGREVVEEKLYPPPVPADRLMTLVDNIEDTILERITPSLLGSYPNTYIFTKAAAENLCKLKGTGLPLAIFRPAIVISSVREPCPGWINNIYGPTGVMAAAAVGLLHVLFVDQNSKANIVPCDYVVNALIASAWSIGTKSTEQDSVPTKYNNDIKLSDTLPNGKPYSLDDTHIPETHVNNQIPNGKLPNGDVLENGPTDNIASAEEYDFKKIPIYNYSCDILKKPFTWKQFMTFNEQREPYMPSNQSVWVYSLTLTRSKRIYPFLCFLLHLIPAFFADTVLRILGQKPRVVEGYNKLHKLAEVLSYFSTQEWKITNDNLWSLWGRLSEEDKKLFDFDMNDIDWDNYYHEHCKGIRKFIMKENPDTIPTAKKRRMILQTLNYMLLSVLSLTSIFMLLKISHYFFLK